MPDHTHTAAEPPEWGVARAAVDLAETLIGLADILPLRASMRAHRAAVAAVIPLIRALDAAGHGGMAEYLGICLAVAARDLEDRMSEAA